MPESGENRPYDLEERTDVFARDVRRFIQKLERTIGNFEDARQVVRFGEAQELMNIFGPIFRKTEGKQ